MICPRASLFLNCFVFLVFFVAVSIEALVVSPRSVFAWPAHVMYVYDGDTVTVAPCGDEESPIFVRLYGVDAPDLKQHFGNEARQWLAKNLPEKSMVEIVPMGFDAYGRVYGLIAKNGQVLNRKLVEEGYAWVWSQMCRAMVCRSWKNLEKAAQDGEKGLWAKKNPIAPWLWGKGIDPLPLQPGGNKTPDPETLIQTLDPLNAVQKQKPLSRDPSTWFHMDPP